MPERRILLAADLDGTLFRSASVRRPGDFAVDISHGRPCAFLSPAAAALLRELRGTLWLVPVTTRSCAQYRRIAWPAGCEPPLAVVANGGILLRRGVPDASWEHGARFPAERLREIADSIRDLPDVVRCGVADGMFVSATCSSAQAAGTLYAALDAAPLRKLISGRKLYLLPPGLDKGSAAGRLLKLPDFAGRVSLLLGAGDSALDLPLLEAADIAVLPPELAETCRGGCCRTAPSREDLPEFVLQMALALADGKYVP